LKETVAKADQEHGSKEIISSISPLRQIFRDIVERISKVGLMHQENGYWRRVIIGKAIRSRSRFRQGAQPATIESGF